MNTPTSTYIASATLVLSVLAAVVLTACGGSESDATVMASGGYSSGASTADMGCSYSYSAFNSSASVNATSTSNWSCNSTSYVVAADGIPDHATGTFPNSGNPNTIAVHNDIEAQVQRGLQLIGDTGPRPLEAVLLNLSPDDNTPTAPARHLVVLGRYSMADATDQPVALSSLKLRLTLFGKSAAHQQQDITITRGSEAQKMVLAPGREERDVFPSAGAVLRDQAALGAQHVLSGLDHMLFLLVVLATGFGWRQIAIALSCFTLGHAITLAATALGVLQVPASLVEPAIAATAIGTALFDRWSRTRPPALSPVWRLALVFGCALIHGSGLACALNLGGLDAQSRRLSLTGFNFGIEVAQLGVAAAVCVLWACARHFRGASALVLTAWLAQRAMFFT
jgi:hypothetical protein